MLSSVSATKEAPPQLHPVPVALVDSDMIHIHSSLHSQLSSEHAGHIKIGGLSRMDMEIIASVSNCLWFSACVSSSNDFKADIMSGTNFGDTIETWRRFIDDETYNGSDFFLKGKRLYFNADHMSKYDFGAYCRLQGEVIEDPVRLRGVLQVQGDPTGKSEREGRIFEEFIGLCYRKEKYKMILTDIKMRSDIVFTGDM